MSKANAERAHSYPWPPSRQSSFQIRVAQAQDLVAVVDILVASFYAQVLENQWSAQWLYWILRVGIQEDIKTRLKLPVSQYTCLVAVQIQPEPAFSDTIVGTAEISQRPCERWQLFPPQRAYLSNLAVQPEFRCQGAAQQLLLSCEGIALNWGFHHIYLHVMSDNSAARALYSKAGYRPCEVSNPILSSLRLRPQRLLLSKAITSESSFKTS